MNANKGIKNQSVKSPTEAIENKFAELRALIDSSDSTLEFEMLSNTEIQFRNCLMENISEAVIFVNNEKKITCWSRSTEQLTGLNSNSMLGMEFSSQLVGLCNEENSPIKNCPIAECMASHQKQELLGLIKGRSGREINVELKVFPVVDLEQCRGCVVLVSDRSVNADLQRQLSDLQNASSLDPLTKVANRAEFEKQLQEYVKAHRATGASCSLIVGDIDYFKTVNDTYGHNIGDQALIAFAQSLKQFVRSRDIVARYGGEEFVILCANCDLEKAVERAEQIRMSLNKTPQGMLDGKTMSASFGVAELQHSENVTDFFVRADEALYAAKHNGRNRVEKARTSTQKQDDIDDSTHEISTATGVKWLKLSSNCLVTEEFRTSTQANMLAEKLRGYIDESDAKILKIEPNHASIEVLAVDPKQKSKKSFFQVDVELNEIEYQASKQPETFIRITIFPPRKKLFGGRVFEELHSHIMTDLRRYFMITDDTAIVRLNPAATNSNRDKS